MKGDLFARMRELLPTTTEVAFMNHPQRSTVYPEMFAAMKYQKRYYELSDRQFYGFRPEWEFYLSNDFRDDYGLYWTCFFYMRRTKRAGLLFDTWWYLLR